ncbi:SH3 domain-containing protein [Streptomyces sp. NPDC012794]|uniref:SH3 domain-containing protein n=1 Tax=Streptomyces sp. NPDC012794 TaxID=3364850 RepID=UPI0036B15490
MKKRLAGAVLAVAAFTAPLAVVAPTTASASAAACSSPGWGPYDSGYSFTVAGKSSPLRSGPNADCGVRAYVPAGTEFSIDCRYVNGAGNLWYHGDVYTGGRSYSGWMYAGNLGSVYDSNDASC